MKTLRQSSVLLVLLSAAFLFAADQKAPANSPQRAQAQQNTPDQVPRGVEHPLPGEQQPAPVGANESSHEEDETKVFKESPSVEWVAKHTGLSIRAAYWVLVIVNFAIILAFIVWAWSKSVPAMFKARTEGIRKNLDEARRASEDANRRLADIESRLAKLDAEIADMRKNAEAEGVAEEQRIRVAAEADRRKVIEGAEQEIDAAAKAARRDLKAYAAALAVSLAEKKIQIDRNTDQALVTRFVHDLAHKGGKDGR